MDPQLIKEQTGHKSDAVMLYKKSNIQQKKEVSAMLSVLPLEMEAIRASQDTMLAREESYERKRKSKSPVAETVSATKKPNVEPNVTKDTTLLPKEETKEKSKEQDTKEVKETKPDVKPSVVLDKEKGLDVHVPVSGPNMVHFRSLQGLINIHFHFHNK